MHSTYVIGGKVRQISWVNRIDFSRFDNIYLMAAPDWKAFDFGKTKEEIIENLVDKFSYPADEDREVIPYFIQKAQESGTRVLISFAGEGFMERVKDSATRDKFTSFLVEFMTKYGFDGIEIDWESDLDLTLHSVLMGKSIKTGCGRAAVGEKVIPHHGPALVAGLRERACGQPLGQH